MLHHYIYIYTHTHAHTDIYTYITLLTTSFGLTFWSSSLSCFNENMYEVYLKTKLKGYLKLQNREVISIQNGRSPA